MVPGASSRGIALYDESAETEQDQKFLAAGERIVLLERLDNGVCMGFCGGATGRFNDADADFSSHTCTISDDSNSPLSSSESFLPAPPMPIPTPIPVLKDGQRQRPHNDNPINTKGTGFDNGRRLPSKQNAKVASLNRSSPTLRVIPQHHTLTKAQSSDLLPPPQRYGSKPKSDDKAGPLYVPSQHELSPPPIISHSRKDASPCPPSAPPEAASLGVSAGGAFSSTMPPPPPPPSFSSLTTFCSASSSTHLSPIFQYPKTYSQYRDSSTGLISPPTHSSASSAVDLHCSSATITTNLLGIKSYVFPLTMERPQSAKFSKQDSYGLKPVPIYQLSTPASSCSSLLSPTRSKNPPTPISSSGSRLPTASSAYSSTMPNPGQFNTDTPVINAVFADTCFQRCDVDGRHGSLYTLDALSIESFDNTRIRSDTPCCSNDQVSLSEYSKFNNAQEESMQGALTEQEKENPQQDQQQQQHQEQQQQQHQQQQLWINNPLVSTTTRDETSKDLYTLSSEPTPPVPNMTLSTKGQNSDDGAIAAIAPTNTTEKPRSENGTKATSLISDIRNKTHHVLRKAGFSIAPDAGLYNHTRARNGGSGGASNRDSDRMDPNNLVAGNIDTGIETYGSSSVGGNTVVGRPRSRSIRERWLGVGRSSSSNNNNNSNSQSMQTGDISNASHMIIVSGATKTPSSSATVSTALKTPTMMAAAQPSPTASISSNTGVSFISVAPSTSSAGSTGFRSEYRRPWTFVIREGSQRQRCNSGPAWHSDPTLAQRAAQTMAKFSLDSGSRSNSHGSFFGGHGHTTSGNNSSSAGCSGDTKDASGIRSFFGSRTFEEVKKRRHLRQISDTTNLRSTEHSLEKSSFLFGSAGRSTKSKIQEFRDPKNTFAIHNTNTNNNQLSITQQCLPPPPQLVSEPSSPGRSILGGFGGSGSRGSDAGSQGEAPKPRSKSHWFGISKRQSYPSSISQGSVSVQAKDDAVPKPSSLFSGKREANKDEDVESEAEADSSFMHLQHHRGNESILTTTPLSYQQNGGTSEKYAAAAASLLAQHQSVNDYGFIYDLEDDDAHDMSNAGSMVGELSVSSMSQFETTLATTTSHLLGADFWADHEKRAAIRKQESIRNSELKWTHAIAQVPVDQVKKSSRFKKMVRKGIPNSVRGRVWQYLAKTNSLRQPGLFSELLDRPPIQPIYDAIERDVHRCYPDHIHFRDGMGGTGQQDLHAILRAYAQYNPRVGYCQGMGRLVGMMLMHMPVEDAFWLLVATLDGYMQEYYTPTLRQLRIDAQVFDQILRAQDPKLAEYLHQKNEVMPLMYMTPWFLTLFTMSLPWASVLQVWDIFYFDGVKSLFRVGLAILQLCRDHLLHQCESSEEVMDFLLHVPLEMLGPKPLFEAAFRIKLSRDSVQRMILIMAGSMDAEEAEKTERVERAEKERKKEKAAAARKAATKVSTGTIMVSTSTSSTSASPSSPTQKSAGLAPVTEESLVVVAPCNNVAPPQEEVNPRDVNTLTIPLVAEGCIITQLAPPEGSQLVEEDRGPSQNIETRREGERLCVVENQARCDERPRSQSSSEASMSVAEGGSSLLSLAPPPTSSSSSSSSSSFPGLGGVFRTRKRAGTTHK